MYCKYCGKSIADDSTFCQFCGGKQDTNTESNSDKKSLKVELSGNVNASLIPELPQFTGLKKICNKNIAFVLAYGVWFIINLILLINGDDRKGFWPHTYTHHELGAEHTHLEYIPWTGHTIEAKYWDVGPEETKISWDIDTYGISEFLIYVVLIPLLIYIVFRVFKYFKEKYLKEKNNKPKKPIKFNYSEGLRRY